MADTIFSDELAFSIARFPSYEKGQEYFQDGRVAKIWEEDGVYRAIVRGTQSYHVSLRSRDEEVVYDCTCPFEGDGACKHVVASVFAFAADPSLTPEVMSPHVNTKTLVIKELLSRMTPLQVEFFLETLLSKQPSLVDDLNIFLQGQTLTPITITDYKARFRTELDRLDLKVLLELWYREGEDYYEGDWDDRDIFSTDSLSDVVDGLMREAGKYEDNQNYGEALKIYQALFEALCQKQETLEGDEAELLDVFVGEAEKVVDRYVQAGIKTDSVSIKRISISFLCSLFDKPYSSIDHEPVVSGLRQIITTQADAVYALDRLKRELVNNELSIAESSLLAFLYSVSHQWQLFETISRANMEKNPGLALDVLHFLQKNERIDDMMHVSDDVLVSLTKKSQNHDAFDYSLSSLDYKRIETQIRQFLKNVYTSLKDYPRTIANGERLFFLTRSLSDYKELSKRYQTTAQKELFWKVMKEYFNKESDAKTIFNVFRLENQKEEVLNLVRAYPDSDCFPDMVDFVKDVYPKECFALYRQKISDLLREANVERYAPAAYHLTRMRTIGCEIDFLIFVEWIKTTYRKRRRLMEELQKHHI